MNALVVSILAALTKSRLWSVLFIILIINDLLGLRRGVVQPHWIGKTEPKLPGLGFVL
jgi:hypothetical protein